MTQTFQTMFAFKDNGKVDHNLWTGNVSSGKELNKAICQDLEKTKSWQPHVSEGFYKVC